MPAPLVESNSTTSDPVPNKARPASTGLSYAQLAKQAFLKANQPPPTPSPPPAVVVNGKEDVGENEVKQSKENGEALREGVSTLQGLKELKKDFRDDVVTKKEEPKRDSSSGMKAGMNEKECEVVTKAQEEKNNAVAQTPTPIKTPAVPAPAPPPPVNIWKLHMEQRQAQVAAQKPISPPTPAPSREKDAQPRQQRQKSKNKDGTLTLSLSLTLT
ncbi:hypothetical protein BZG36_05290 [Bifiguratus adelaidae]|uniref:Uncharacterized protein n=1 Tax=Bifiguratus adelaidae TaxID=1938954 RepID=A0A261XUT9_9FUNG|nr:hypothetical protein BZG36_05290 [Bifiguratus adelaidae]